MDAFAGSLEHVLAEVERLDLLVRLRVHVSRELKQKDDRFEGLYLTQTDIDGLLREPIGLPRWATDPLPSSEPEVQRLLTDIEESVHGRVLASLNAGVRLRLVELVQYFDLGRLELDVLLFALLPELDLRYERLFAFLQDDVSRRRPAIELALNVLCPSLAARLAARQHFTAQAPLVRHRLIELFDDAARPNPPLHGKHIRLAERVASFLLDVDALDSNLIPFASLADLDPDALPVEPPPVVAAFNARLAAELKTGPRLVHLRGAPGTGKQTWASQLCAAVGLRLLVIDTPRMLRDRSLAPEVHIVLAVREALLQSAGLFWRGFDALLADEHQSALATLEQTLLESRLPVCIFAGALPFQPHALAALRRLRALEVPAPTYAERLQIWRGAVGEVPDDTLAELPRLASKFRLPGGEIVAAAQVARATAELAGRAALHSADLHAACRARSTLRLGNLARKLHPVHTLDDLVLLPSARAELRALCDRVQHSAAVLDGWGFASRLSRGKGLAAIFAGPSGTGKTMAAEAVAHELGLDLYAIDLSAIVSKYIGETEKNLGRVFDEAETSNAILFFDEADALFGKRGEVKDSHDRYANIETGFLLQKMEEYPGISILATNLRRNIDDAFTRRMAFIINFAPPDERERLEIWQKIWPAGAPLGEDIDLEWLAQNFKFTGGNIKNIALGAAFQAASEGSVVLMRHVVAATRREVEKTGKSWGGEVPGTHDNVRSD